MGESCENRPKFVQINRFPHPARRGVLGSASPFLTRDLRFPRTTLATAFGGDLRSVDIRAAFCETRPNFGCIVVKHPR